MDFDFSLEQKQLQDQVRRYLADHCDRNAVRKILDGPEPTDRALWKGLGEMGFLGASIPEQYGGLGAGYLEACVIAEELGRAVAPVPFSSSIALAAEFLLQAGNDEQKSRLLPKLASGEAIGTLAWVERSGRPNTAPLTTQAKANGQQYQLTGRKIAVADGDIADFAVVTATLDGDAARAGQFALFLVDLNGQGVTRTGIATIDPTRSHADVQFDGAAAELLGAAGDGAKVLQKVFDRAAVLIAFEQIGGADRALEMGRDYAMERFAFGRPIGSLQAIKHMLADMYVSATLARSNALFGAWALSTDAPELPGAAATARVSATQAYQHCARNNIQVHGGMGFTWEFDCHLYYRRSNLLALTLGSLSVWEDRLITLLREERDARQAA